MECNALIQPDFILDMQRKVLNIPKHFFFSSACLFPFRVAFKILPAMALSKKCIMKVKTLALHSSWILFLSFLGNNSKVFFKTTYIYVSSKCPNQNMLESILESIKF